MSWKHIPLWTSSLVKRGFNSFNKLQKYWCQHFLYACFSPSFLWYGPAQTYMSSQLFNLESLQTSWILKWFTNQERLSPEFSQINHSPSTLIFPFKMILLKKNWSPSLIYETSLVVPVPSCPPYFRDPSFCQNRVANSSWQNQLW